jgi:ABC-2 type transport system ATP-binding protein
MARAMQQFIDPRCSPSHRSGAGRAPLAHSRHFSFALSRRVMELHISQLTKTYANGVRALDGVTLKVSTGMFGLLGPNGAGKSTLMRTLATLQEADSGSAVLRGVSGGVGGGMAGGEIDVLRQKDAVRGVLGYLPQDFGVYAKVSAQSLLDHFARLKGLVDAKARRETVDALLERVNLHAVRKQQLGGFSGGMRQRFGIAQALLCNPKLVIVDEPTAGLDPEERVRFHNLLADIGSDVIVILSTHIVSDVADLCNHLAVIDGGRVLLTGRPEALVAGLRGCIWRRAVDKIEIEGLKTRLRLVSTRLQGGHTVVRAYSPGGPPEAGFELVETELEDIYFCSIAGYLNRPIEAVA